MTVVELADMLERHAREFIDDDMVLSRNRHMLGDHPLTVDKATRRVVLVMFLNTVMRAQGMDLALYADDLVDP